MTADIEQRMQIHAGDDFRQPRRIHVASVCFADYATPDGLVAALLEFNVLAQGSNLAVDEYEDSNHTSGFGAWRMEDETEVARRVEDVRAQVLALMAQSSRQALTSGQRKVAQLSRLERQELYRALKAEFERK